MASTGAFTAAHGSGTGGRACGWRVQHALRGAAHSGRLGRVRRRSGTTRFAKWGGRSDRIAGVRSPAARVDAHAVRPQKGSGGSGRRVTRASVADPRLPCARVCIMCRQTGK